MQMDSGMEPQDAGTDAGVAARDLDIAVVKLRHDGTLDTSFGTGGKAILDFGAASGSARDSVYSFDVDAMGRVVLFGSTKGTGRTDVDRYVARLSANGQLDTSFGVDGLHRLDLGGTNENARHGFVQADGKIIAAGYTALPTGVPIEDGGVQTANTIVLLRLESNGAPDTTFGTDGLVKLNPFPSAMPATLPWGLCEAYAAVQQSGGRYVTVGYGRRAATGTVDLTSVRLDNMGVQDTTWAGTGAIVFDLIGGDERGRHAVALADDRVVFVGSGTPLTGNIDALVSIVRADGTPDTSFGTAGTKLYAFGRNDEAFFGSAVGPGGMTLAVAGYRVGAANNDQENDDAVLALIPLSTGAPAEIAQPVPLSTTTHDRFLGVAWDGAQVVAAGFVREGTDTKFAVARFNADGTRDTTFGTGGLVTINTSMGGTEEVARWVKVLADGSILLAGPVEH
ncbi:MAG: hypothetical protein QM817_28930 [Archangium sp.]